MSENDSLGYDYGGMFFKLGEKLHIIEHIGCNSNEGMVKQISGLLPPEFYIACLKCLKKGMIPDLRVFFPKNVK